MATAHTKVKPVKSVVLPLWADPKLNIIAKQLAIINPAWGHFKVRMEAV